MEREHGGECTARFRQDLGRRFQPDGMIHTLLDPCGSRQRHWRPGRSLLSERHREWDRSCDHLE